MSPDVTKATISERHIDDYYHYASLDNSAVINEEIILVIGQEETAGQTTTLLYHQSGRFYKTSQSVTDLFVAFGESHSIIDWRSFRHTLNFLKGTTYRSPGYITPHYTFSKFHKFCWINLNFIKEYRPSLEDYCHYSRTIIHFHNSHSFELFTGIKSVRRTCLIDSLESLGLKEIFSVDTSPETNNQLLAAGRTPYVTDLMLKLTRNKKNPLATITQGEFIRTMTLFTTHVPLVKYGIFEKSDYHLLDPQSREILKTILIEEQRPSTTKNNSLQ